MRAFTLVLVALVAGCEQKNPAESARGAPTVIIYESMTRASAKNNACGMIAFFSPEETEARRECKRIVEDKQRAFSQSFRAFLASEPVCNTVKFITKDIDVKKPWPPVTGPFFFFHMNFDPATKTQSWTLNGDSVGQMVGGIGDERKIARTICSIVTNKGGTLN